MAVTGSAAAEANIKNLLQRTSLPDHVRSAYYTKPPRSGTHSKLAANG